MQKNNLTILLFLSFIFTLFFSPIRIFSLTEQEAKENASKGSVYNPQTISVDSYAVINDKFYANNISYEDGDVVVEKRVKNIDDGKYNISFWIKGKEIQSSKTIDTYIVFVVDRSYTMGENNRWNNAINAVTSVSKNLSEIEGIKMASVAFSGGKASDKPYNDTVFIRESFNSEPFTKEEFGNYDTDNQKTGGTNIYAGLYEAQKMLANKIGNKYIILLSDGVPTFYYDSNGYTIGPGNSKTKEQILNVVNCKNAAIEIADTIKDNEIEIITVGYDIDKLTYSTTIDGIKYSESKIAIDTLTQISSKPTYFYQADTSTDNSIIKILGEVEKALIKFPAGYNPSIVDNIGTEFKLEGSDEYGGSKTLTTSDNFKITNEFQKIGEFNVTINPFANTQWHNINNNFRWSYKTNQGNTNSFTCKENPEVYWEGIKYNYTINYYKDKITNINNADNYLGSISEKAEHGEIINLTQDILLNKLPIGYQYIGAYDLFDKEALNIIIDRNKDNIINVLYSAKKYNYIVNYHFNEILDQNMSQNYTDYYGNNILAQDNYLEKINYSALENKNRKDNANYFIDPNNKSNISVITITDDPLRNILNLYYISTNIINESIDKSSETRTITSNAQKVDYNIKYNCIIDNTNKDGKIIVEIKDYMPYEIDEKLSNLNNGIYDKKNKTITWIFEETVDNFSNNYRITKEFNYEVVYKNFADISAKKSNEINNKVFGRTTVNNIKSEGVFDDEKIPVEIKGEIIVNYITKNNEKLSDSQKIVDFVGSDYKTVKKSFDKYSLIQVIGNSTGKIVEGKHEVTYIYDTTPLPPKTGKESNYLLFIILFIISYLLIIIKNH